MEAIIGVASAFLPVGLAAWTLFICTGMIFGMGLLVARFLGEDLLGKTRMGVPIECGLQRSLIRSHNK